MSVAVSVASAADDAGVRRLLRSQVMPGRVRLSFCREPDFSIGCAVTGDDYRVLVARAQPDDEVVGVACRSVRRVFLNGREQRLGYLGQLRVDDRYRGGARDKPPDRSESCEKHPRETGCPLEG